MALAPAISKQPTKKLQSLKTMRLTIGFLAIGSQLIRTGNAVERRGSGLWPPVFRVSGPGPSSCRANLHRHSPISFWQGTDRFDSGRRPTDTIYVLLRPARSKHARSRASDSRLQPA